MSYKVQYWNSYFKEWLTIEKKEDYADTLETQGLIEGADTRCRVLHDGIVVYETKEG